MHSIRFNLENQTFYGTNRGYLDKKVSVELKMWNVCVMYIQQLT